MRKLFFFTSLFLIAFSIQAQDLLKIDNITITNAALNNIEIQVEVDNVQQNLLSRINETNVNGKVGFNAQLNSDNTLLTLNFTQKFDKRELYTLLEYCGIKFNVENFNELYNLLNQ